MANGCEAADHFVLICTKCRDCGDAPKLRSSLKESLPAGFVLRAVDCMAGCDFPATIGFQAAGKTSYLFGNIDDAEDISAIIEFSHQYRQSDSGWTTATERPVALFDKTLARIPALRSVGRS